MSLVRLPSSLLLIDVSEEKLTWLPVVLSGMGVLAGLRNQMNAKQSLFPTPFPIPIFIVAPPPTKTAAPHQVFSGHPPEDEQIHLMVRSKELETLPSELNEPVLIIGLAGLATLVLAGADQNQTRDVEFVGC